LAKAESVLRISIDNLLEGVQVIGFDWKYLYLNATAARHGVRPADELLGRTIMAAYPGVEQTEMFALLARVMRTRRAERMLNEFTYSDGERRWFELLVEPVPDGICVLSLDATARLEAERQLQQAQKMEVVGQLTGGWRTTSTMC
jgi:PAS domain S-box-containing protein